MSSFSYEEYYMFELDQLQKDQNFFNEVLRFDYMKVTDITCINEGIVELVGKFFKWIIQKLKDMKDFLVRTFSKIFGKITEKTNTAEDKIEKVSRKIKNKTVELKNVEISNFNFISFNDTVNLCLFSKCGNLNKALLILDFYQNIDMNEEKIRLNAPEFVKIVDKEGYLSAINDISGALASFKKMNLKSTSSDLKSSSTMKQFIFSSIYFNNDREDDKYTEYVVGDIKADGQYLTGLKLDLQEINKQIPIIKKSVKDNEDGLSKTKKKIESIQNNMGAVKEDIFNGLKMFSSSLITLFNYNRDILIWLSQLATAELNYINKMINTAEKAFGE